MVGVDPDGRHTRLRADPLQPAQEVRADALSVQRRVDPDPVDCGIRAVRQPMPLDAVVGRLTAEKDRRAARDARPVAQDVGFAAREIVLQLPLAGVAVQPLLQAASVHDGAAVLVDLQDGGEVLPPGFADCHDSLSFPGCFPRPALFFLPDAPVFCGGRPKRGQSARAFLSGSCPDGVSLLLRRAEELPAPCAEEPLFSDAPSACSAFRRFRRKTRR